MRHEILYGPSYSLLQVQLEAAENAVAEPGAMVSMAGGVDTGHIVAFDAWVDYSVRCVGGIKSTLFGGEGLVADFTGPGRVWLQTRSPETFLG